MCSASLETRTVEPRCAYRPRDGLGGEEKRRATATDDPGKLRGVSDCRSEPELPAELASCQLGSGRSSGVLEQARRPVAFDAVCPGCPRDHPAGRSSGNQRMNRRLMNNGMDLETLLPGSGKTPARQLALVALLNLGVIESLANGLLSATEAVHLFFNADNCPFVRKGLREKTAEKIMSHGVQLPD